MSTATAPSPSISTDQIRVAAYYLFLERLRDSQPGDALSDWLKAEAAFATELSAEPATEEAPFAFEETKVVEVAEITERAPSVIEEEETSMGSEEPVPAVEKAEKIQLRESAKSETLVATEPVPEKAVEEASADTASPSSPKEGLFGKVRRLFRGK